VKACNGDGGNWETCCCRVRQTRASFITITRLRQVISRRPSTKSRDRVVSKSGMAPLTESGIVRLSPESTVSMLHNKYMEIGHCLGCQHFSNKLYQMLPEKYTISAFAVVGSN
jgi:hypothetical protein